MSRLALLKKRVEKLEESVAPKHPEEIWVVFWVPLGCDGDPDEYVECVEMYSGKKFKCRRGEYKQMIRLHSQADRASFS